MAECPKCPLNSLIQAFSTITQKFPKKIKDGPKVYVRNLNYGELMVRNASSKEVEKRAKAFLPKFEKLVEYVQNELYPTARKICLKCSELSNDDNLSRGGRVFVSMDAMPDGVKLAQDGGNGTGNWLNKNAIARSKEGTGQVSALPSHIEDTLLKTLHDFSMLSVFEQNFIIHQMKGRPLVEFASMTWVPQEMRQPQSTEFVSYRWSKLAEKFPLANALRKGRIVGSKAGKGGSAEGVFVQEELSLNSRVDL